MAEQTYIIPPGTTVKFAVRNGSEYCLLPLGNTVFTPPTDPTHDHTYSVTYGVEMEIKVNDSDKLTDSSAPPKYFGRYVGARPSGR